MDPDARQAAPELPPRSRRSRENIRELLLEAAIVEFGAKGFDGASTVSIAARADAHQPQINYHFESKAALWEAAVDHLFTALAEHLDGLDYYGDPPAACAELIGRTVAFAAQRPQVHQIMMSESTMPTERLNWVIETHVREGYEGLRLLWTHLREEGIAAPVDPSLIHYVLIGAASTPYLHRAGATLLLGEDPASQEVIERHTDGLIATLLPGWNPADGG
jgi:TetR/AcrR family transcriptional regulator